MDDDTRAKLVIFGTFAAFVAIFALLIDVIEKTVRLFFPGLFVAFLLLIYANHKRWFKLSIPEEPSVYVDVKGLTPREKNIVNVGIAIANKCVDGYESSSPKFDRMFPYWSYSERCSFKQEMIYYRIMVFSRFLSEERKNHVKNDMTLLWHGANEAFGQIMGEWRAELIYERTQTFKGHDIPDRRSISTLLENAQLARYQSNYVYSVLMEYLSADVTAHMQYMRDLIRNAF